MFIHFASVAVLAFAVSLDSFGVGVTYGLRKIKIPLLSILIIALCSGFIIWLSMQLGNVITPYISQAAAKWIGAIILMVIGCMTIMQYVRNSSNRHIADQDNNQMEYNTQISQIKMQSDSTVLRLELKSLGVVIQILKTPQAADLDRSGIISSSEAMMLGIALSLDALGAGFGAAMLGLPALLTAVAIALFSALFLIGGISIGMKFSTKQGMKYVSFLPGILLILFGILKLL